LEAVPGTFTVRVDFPPLKGGDGLSRFEPWRAGLKPGWPLILDFTASDRRRRRRCGFCKGARTKATCPILTSPVGSMTPQTRNRPALRSERVPGLAARNVRNRYPARVASPGGLGSPLIILAVWSLASGRAARRITGAPVHCPFSVRPGRAGPNRVDPGRSGALRKTVLLAEKPAPVEIPAAACREGPVVTKPGATWRNDWRSCSYLAFRPAVFFSRSGQFEDFEHFLP